MLSLYSHVKAGEEKSEEQLAQLAEKRKEAGRRLQDQAAKNRVEKARMSGFKCGRSSGC